MSGSDSDPDRPGPDAPLDCEEIYIYSEKDLEAICSDVWLDLREVAGEQAAAQCIEIVHDRLTDDFYSE
jgi:hypothetical protein